MKRIAEKGIIGYTFAKIPSMSRANFTKGIRAYGKKEDNVLDRGNSM